MNFKKLIIVAVTVAAVFAASASDSPRYVFYFIGDGMGLGHVNAAQAYNRIVRGNKEPLMMMQFPVASVATTYSASWPVTDSAAAGTALATGHKTANGMLGMTPDTVAVQSIAADLFRNGWGVGIVTSVTPDDATPRAFYAHQPSRSRYFEIGKQALESGYQFIAGSTLRGTKDKEGNPTGLVELFRENGVDVVYGTAGLEKSTAERILLLNPENVRSHNIGYTIDSIQGVLNLPDMTRSCLAHLEKTSPEHFFMMVEGGNIDHAAHANDGGTVIKEIINFNEAIGVAYKFYLAHPEETLIVVTADHDTGGMSFDFKWGADLGAIDYQRVSKDRFSDWCRGLLKSRRNFTWEDMKEYLSENLGFWTGVPVTEQEAEKLRAAFDKTFEMRNSADQKTLYNTFNEFAVAVFNVLNEHAGVSFTTTSHAGNLVPVYAIGVGVDSFKGFNDNTDIPATILKLTQGVE